MYYRWRNVGNWRCPEIVSYTRLDPDEAIWVYYTHDGLPLKKPLPEITFQVDTFEGLSQMDSLWAGMPYLMFSPRLRESLSAAGVTNVEYYPARIENRRTGEVISDYMIANIVGSEFCMDWKHSKYTPDPDLPGYVAEITHLVLDPAKIPPQIQLFRLGELSSFILCDETVRASLNRWSIKGVELEEVEAVTPQETRSEHE